MGYIVKISTLLCFLLCLFICFVCVQSAPPFNGWPDMNRRVPARMEPPGCVYKGQKYEHGEQIATPEPCLNCTCIKGLLVCYLRVCPTAVAPRPGCFPAREVGECCPTVICGINDLLPQPDKTNLEGDESDEPRNETIQDADVIDLRPTFKPSSKEPDISDSSITTESISGTKQISSTLHSVTKTDSETPSIVQQQEISHSSEYPDHVINQFTQTLLTETEQPTRENTNLSPTTSSEITDENTSAYEYSTGPYSSESVEKTSLKDLAGGTTHGVSSTGQVLSTSSETSWWGSTSSRDTEDTHTTLEDSMTKEDVSAPSEFTVSVQKTSPDVTGTTVTFPSSVMGGSSYEGDSLVFVTSSTLPTTIDATDYDISFLNDIPGGCLVNGTLYGDGSAMLSASFCEYCFCIRGKQTCLKPKCHLVVEGCAPKYDSEFTCCPTRYDCSSPNSSKTAFSDEPEITTSREVTTEKTTPPEIEGFCTVGEAIYLVGEAVPSEVTCSTCFCTTSGVVCKKVSCSPPVEGCKPYIPEGHCCPTEYRCDDQVRLHEDSENYLQPHPTRSVFLTTTAEEKEMTSDEFPSSLWIGSNHQSKHSTIRYPPLKEEQYIVQEGQEPIVQGHEHFVQEPIIQEGETSALFTTKDGLTPHRQQILDILIPAERRLDGVTAIEEYLRALATTRVNTEISKDPNPVYIPQSTTRHAIYTGRTFETQAGSNPDMTKSSDVSEYTFNETQDTNVNEDNSRLHVSVPVSADEKDLTHITVAILPKEQAVSASVNHTSTYSYINDPQTTNNQSAADTVEDLLAYSVSKHRKTTEWPLDLNKTDPFHSDELVSSTEKVYDSTNSSDGTTYNFSNYDQKDTSGLPEFFKRSGIHSDSKDIDSDFGTTAKMSEMKTGLKENLATSTDQYRASTTTEEFVSKTSNKDSTLNSRLGFSDTSMSFKDIEFSSTEPTISQKTTENADTPEKIPGITLDKDEKADTVGNHTKTTPKIDVSEGDELRVNAEIENIRDKPIEISNTTGLPNLDTMPNNISGQQITAHDNNVSLEDGENVSDHDISLHANVSDHDPSLHTDVTDHDTSLHTDVSDHDTSLQTDVSDHDTSLHADVTDHTTSLYTDVADHDTSLHTDFSDHDTSLHTDVSDHDTSLHTDVSNHDTSLHTDVSDHNTGLHADVTDHTTSLYTDVSDHDTSLHTELSDHDTSLHTEFSDHDTSLQTEFSDHDASLNSEFSDHDASLNSEFPDQDTNLHTEVSDHAFKDSVTDFSNATLPDSLSSTASYQDDLSESFATLGKLDQNKNDANLNIESNNSEIETATPPVSHLVTNVSNIHPSKNEQGSASEDLLPSPSTSSEIMLTDRNTESEDHTTKYPAVALSKDAQQSHLEGNISLSPKDNYDHQIKNTDQGTTHQWFTQSEKHRTEMSDDSIEDNFKTFTFESQRGVTQNSKHATPETELEKDSSHFTLTRMPSTIPAKERDESQASKSTTYMPTTQGGSQASVPQLYEEGYDEYDYYSADDLDESHLRAEGRHTFDDAPTFRISGHVKHIPKRPQTPFQSNQTPFQASQTPFQASQTPFQASTDSVDTVADGTTVGIIHIGVPLTVEGYSGSPKKDTIFNDIYVVDGGKGRTTESGGVIYMDPKYTDIKPEVPPLFNVETRFPKTTEITTLSYRNPFYSASSPSISSISIDRADHDILQLTDKKKPRIEDRKPTSSSDSEGNQNVKIIPFVAEDALTSLGKNKNQTVLAQQPTTKPTSDIVSDFCFVSGRIYINGEMIVKPDPCELCRCFYGRELCQLQRCPKPPSPDCTPEHLPGFCCPRYTCNGNPKPESGSDNQPATEIISAPGKPFAPKKPDISNIPSLEDEPERQDADFDYSYELDATTEIPQSDSEEFDESYENIPDDEQNSQEKDEENVKHTTTYPDTVDLTKETERKPEIFTDLQDSTFKFGNRVRPPPSLIITPKPVVRLPTVNTPRRPIFNTPRRPIINTPRRPTTLLTTSTTKPTVSSSTTTIATTTTTTQRTTKTTPTSTTSSTTPVTTKASTTTTTTTEKPKSSTAADVPLFDPWGLLKVSGCNIYGKFYSVNERVEILSGPCNHCICASNGVECNDIC